MNAVKLAADFVAAFPRDGISPETTEEREGFVHPHKVVGVAEETCVEFIVRDHDATKMDAHLELIRRLAGDPASASRALPSRSRRKSSTGTWAR